MAVSNLIVDDNAGTICCPRNRVIANLTQHQFTIFNLLYKNFGRYVRKYEIENELYGLRPECDWPDNRHIIAVKICYLRKKLANFDLEIVNRANFGWKLQNKTPD